MHDANRSNTSPADRMLPRNIEAERCVLGAILINNDAFNQAAELIDSEDFFRDAHRRLFDRMVDLNERNEMIDLVTLKNELEKCRELNKIGGPAYIAGLIDGVPRAVHVDHYAKIVKEKSTRRKIIAAANRILDMAYSDEGDAETVLDHAQQAIFSIADEAVTTGFVPLSELVQSSHATIEALQSGDGPVNGVPSGFEDLDKLTRGFQPADLILVAARPSMGKTALVLNIAQYLGIETDKTVGIFSLEMSRDSLFMRMLTTEAQIDAHRLRGGFLRDTDYDAIGKALTKLDGASVYIDDSPSIGVLEMRAKTRRLKAEHGLDLVIVDYLQLMTGRGGFDNRTLELAAVSRALKGLAKELNVPVIALSQLNRNTENRSDRRPQLSDLRESGALEQDADLVLFLFREEIYNPTPENENLAEIIIGKQRNGPTGSVHLAFLKQCTKFATIAREAYDN